jgi:hypothetical protein
MGMESFHAGVIALGQGDGSNCMGACLPDHPGKGSHGEREEPRSSTEIQLAAIGMLLAGCHSIV